MRGRMIFLFCYNFLFSLTIVAFSSAFLVSPRERSSPSSNCRPLEWTELAEGCVRRESRGVLMSSSVDNIGTDQPALERNSSLARADILICGGGPTGLLAAIMLAQKFPQSHIQVHDRQPMPALPTDEEIWADTSKYYLIGLGGRGITALEKYGVWTEDVAPFTLPVPGRKDWTPEQPDGLETIRSDRKYITRVLPRDKLVSILHQHIVEHYCQQQKQQIELIYESIVRPVDFDYTSDDGDHENGSPKVLVEMSNVNDQTNWTPLVANFVIASDGSARTFANRMEELDRQAVESGLEVENPFRVVRFEDDNVRVYKKLPFRLPGPSWTITTDMTGREEGEIFWNYAVRSAQSRVIFDALPANANGDYVGVLLMRGDDAMAQPNVDPAVFRTFLQEQLPPVFVDLLDEDAITAAALQSASEFPKFRHITPRMHQGARTVLLGDTAHTVKPFFGMGANSALEDVKIFGECIDASPDMNLTQAIWRFSKLRTPDVETLVRISRDLDRPGLLGVIYFLIPVILDGIFQKLAPQVFQPNIISLIQNEEYTFQQAVHRKQQDMVGQLLIVGGILHGLVVACTSAVGYTYQMFVVATATTSYLMLSV